MDRLVPEDLDEMDADERKELLEQKIDQTGEPRRQRMLEELLESY